METKKKPLIILTGPTAVGKTDLSIALAKAVNGAVISADSMQVYRYMDIGSAKISKKENQCFTSSSSFTTDSIGFSMQFYTLFQMNLTPQVSLSAAKHSA